jgi:hypothetical protein
MERRSLAKTVATVGGVQLPPHVSIMGNRFTLVDGAGNRRPLQSLSLDCVILDMNEKMSRMYYGDDRAYDPDDPQPPRCFSDNGIAPSTRSAEPQAASCQPDATGTKGCRWSVWGSATSKMTGDKIPACQNGLKLGLMVVKPGKKGSGDDWIPALPGDNSGMVFFLRVPPASLTAAANYGKSIAGMSKLTIPWTGEEVPCDLNYVVTRISFVDGATGKLAFEAVGYIGEQIDNVIDGIDQDKVDTAIGRTDQPIAALPPPETKAERVAVTQAKPLAASEKRGRGRPPGSKNGPAATPAAKKTNEPVFRDPPGIRILTSQTIKDEAEARNAKAARREQEGREAAQAAMVDEAPEPPDSENPALDEFMNMDLK